MSYIAPSPPMTQILRSGWPAWSHRARMPSASAGAFSKSELVHGTRNGLYGIGTAVDGVAAGGRHDPHRLRSVDLAGCGDQHADGRCLAAAGAAASTTDIAEGMLAEHQIGQGLVRPIRLRGRWQRAEERHVAGIAIQGRLASGFLGDLGAHHQGVVAERVADLNAFGASLAVDRVDEDAETCGLQAAPGREIGVLGGSAEVAGGGRRCQRWVRLPLGKAGDQVVDLRFGERDPQDGAVGAGVDAGHAAHASGCIQLGDLRSQVAEVANRSGPRRNDGARHTGVGGQLRVGGAAQVGRHDPAIEVIHVLVDVEERDGGRHGARRAPPSARRDP